mmetsp:Transcript_56884/g.144247  ORF Transcript_56884/g.144247 Transcript_56884/m.144247 type:complete len:386 (-) Transcript_56884:15-1172(-)
MLDPGTYDGETDLCGLRHGRGTYVYPNAFFTYDGAWDRGVKHGHGKLQLGDGSYYEGCFDKGEIQGEGKRVWPSGASYTGQFHLGEKSGEGTHVSADGVVYKGAWQQNRRHGYGVLQRLDGAVYEGEFVHHQQSGQGTLTEPGGTTYTGQWMEGIRHGAGRMSWPDGSTYDGQWQQGSFEGHGSCSITDTRSDVHRSYIGNWKTGAPTQQSVALAWQGVLPVDGNASEEADAGPDAAAAETPWALIAGAPIPNFAVRCVDDAGATAVFESGRVIVAMLRRRAQREVVDKKKGKKSPEPEEPQSPPEVLSETPIGSAPSSEGVVLFSTLSLPADVEPTSYDGEYELAFFDQSPDHVMLPFVAISSESDAKICIRIDPSPPDDEEQG